MGAPGCCADAIEARRLLSYDPETGLFRWKISRGGQRAGAIAGQPNDQGYWVISFRPVGAAKRRLVRAHRLAWLMQTGQWPDHEVDHRDLCRPNNRWANLRAATDQQQQANTSMQKNNSSGHRGVSWDKRKEKWRAVIKVNYRHFHLGYFETKAAAAGAYNARAIQEFGEFARGE